MEEDQQQVDHKLVMAEDQQQVNTYMVELKHKVE